ncbi:ABC transporter substrate-binding protein [Paenibacillus radicis (ex Xue et al. 2023)]|uniref:ABC transporter substrate-binding protein n=1 Tax=Paenibacillus radicis (ex Xue et al. 2023) TaxID=2972489 RepID=A0ABT1YB82_9BACL|nr:ABC transporter substrate-binding protein [Paenibacillus radicis (ex Xue et al. 2023)]MCR8630451.1 ABC transporter substrate-binding protein [Paenibacillus radicis (ex Xue et al. 2023)]
MKSASNRLRRNAGILLSVWLLAMTVLSACSGTNTVDSKETKNTSPNKAVEITFAWWGTTVHNERYQKIIDLFQQKNPNIKINAQYADVNAFWEKLAVQAAGRNLPELMQMDLTRINEWVSRDLLQPLDPFIQQDVINLKNVNPMLVSGGKVNNQTFALPVGTNSPAMIYDPAMFEKAGVKPLEPGYTWEQLASTSRQLKEKLGKDYYVMPLDGMLGFYHYLRERGLWFYNKENNGLGFDDQVLIDFLNYWAPLRKDGVSPPANITVSIKKNEDKLIVKNKSPIDFMYDAQTQAIQELSGRKLELTVLPTTPGGQKALYFKPSVMLAVTKETSPEKAKAAAQFIDFFTRSEEANLILLGIRGTPIHKELMDIIYPKLDESVKKIIDYSKTVEPYAAPLYTAEPAGYSEVTSLWDKLNEQLIFEKTTPEGFAKQLREGVKKIFAK